LLKPPAFAPGGFAFRRPRTISLSCTRPVDAEPDPHPARPIAGYPSPSKSRSPIAKCLPLQLGSPNASVPVLLPQSCAGLPMASLRWVVTSRMGQRRADVEA
jgi:hypothetical protein